MCFSTNKRVFFSQIIIFKNKKKTYHYDDEDAIKINKEVLLNKYKGNLLNATWICTKKIVKIDKVIYNYGSNRLLRHLTFRNGYLSYIYFGERGFGNKAFD